MKPAERLNIKLVHCGNWNPADPDDNLEKGIFYIPMGVFSLASILKKENFIVEIIHLDLEDKDDRNIREIIDLEAADAVGLDLHWVNQGVVVLKTAELIKKIKPGIFIFIGGYTAGFFAEEILTDYPFIDAVIRGDGEVPIVELCNALKNAKSNNHSHDHTLFTLKNVPNLIWKGENSKVIFNELSYVSTAAEIDKFEFSEITLLKNRQVYIELSRYWTNFPQFKSLPLFSLEIGRGCKYNCIYCGGNAAAQMILCRRDQQAVRSVDSVLSSIKKGIAFGFKLFLACFEFDGSDDWYMELSKRLIKENIRLSFVYECWKLPSKSLVDALSACCDNFLITISPDTAAENLRKLNRDKRLFFTNRELEELLDYIAAGNNVSVQLYFSYFLRCDCETSVYSTFDYITALFFRYSGFCEFIYMNLNTDPCSPIFLDPEQQGLNVAVGSLKDYLNEIDTNYIKKYKKIPGISLLAKPAALTDIEAVNLANKINLFQKCLIFRKSIRVILVKVKNMHIFSEYFKKIDLSFALQSDMTIDSAEKVLLNICRKYIPGDSETIDLIRSERENIPSFSYVNNLTNVYTFERDTRVPGRGESKQEKGATMQRFFDSIQSEFDI